MSKFTTNFMVKKNKRTSFVDQGAAARLQIGVNACEQIKKFGFSYLKKDQIESFKLCSVKAVAQFLDLNPETLRRHQAHKRENFLIKTDNVTGQRPLLGKHLEAELIRYLIWMDERGFPLTWPKVAVVARDLSKMHNVEDFIASPGWISCFRKR